jgi:hypothetical protein
VAGWDGDRLQIYADGSREAWLLISAWDSRGDAEQFFAAYQDLIRLELGEDAQQVVAEETRSWWQQGRRIAYVSRQDTQVLVVWAPDEETLNALLSRLSGSRPPRTAALRRREAENKAGPAPRAGSALTWPATRSWRRSGRAEKRRTTPPARLPPPRPYPS